MEKCKITRRQIILEDIGLSSHSDDSEKGYLALVSNR
jgi:hypothetical protein